MTRRSTTTAEASAPNAHAPNATAVPVLRVARPLLARLRELASAAWPHEACGLLVGTSTERAVDVARLTEAENLATERLRDRYTLAPADFLRADAAARRDGFDIVGVWHTHPDHPARPSPTDLAAAWPSFSYVIVSVTEVGVADLRSFRLDGEHFAEQPIVELDR
jgi:proteasome lid subunit RPN8/RPN11